MIEKMECCIKIIKAYAYDVSYTTYEFYANICNKLNDIIDVVNNNFTTLYNMIVANYDELLALINENFTDLDTRKEDSINITNSRLLSETGDFTGTLCGDSKTACEVVQEINDNRNTIEYIAEQINSKTAIQYIVDGGLYPFTGTPTIELDGGLVLWVMI